MDLFASTSSRESFRSHRTQASTNTRSIELKDSCRLPLPLRFFDSLRRVSGFRRAKSFDVDLGQIDQVIFRGSLFMDEVVFFHRASSTCLVCDLIQRHNPAQQTGWQGWLMRFDGLVGVGGSTPREWRASFIHRARARRALETALAWNPDKLVIAHGVWAPSNGADILRRALSWLKPAIR